MGSMVLPMFFKMMDKVGKRAEFRLNLNPYMVPNCSTVPSKIGKLINPYRNNTSRA